MFNQNFFFLFVVKREFSNPTTRCQFADHYGVVGMYFVYSSDFMESLAKRPQLLSYENKPFHSPARN